MSAADIYLSREFLKAVHQEVKEKFPNFDLRTAAGVYRYTTAGPSLYQFCIPGVDFVVDVRADNAYDARAKGWALFLTRTEEATG